MRVAWESMRIINGKWFLQHLCNSHCSFNQAKRVEEALVKISSANSHRLSFHPRFMYKVLKICKAWNYRLTISGQNNDRLQAVFIFFHQVFILWHFSVQNELQYVVKNNCWNISSFFINTYCSVFRSLLYTIDVH